MSIPKQYQVDKKPIAKLTKAEQTIGSKNKINPKLKKKPTFWERLFS